ncbi:MAGUK p55 subfamily member 7-like [Sphaeramia orbicularis]|uniref:MAGUK p55 subfamily member 7-like n=1 Tax=Sphaeramia orbicularis TaxID=375764 RepID=UPI001180E9C2|nr:MAGUK p55 subfamily member 7-like [Sphaeramia orbicularis]
MLFHALYKVWDSHGCVSPWMYVFISTPDEVILAQIVNVDSAGPRGERLSTLTPRCHFPQPEGNQEAAGRGHACPGHRSRPRASRPQHVPPGVVCLYELLAALPSQLQPHVSRPEDNAFLQDMFGEKSLHSLIKIHERLQHYEESKAAPVMENAATLASELSEELQGKLASGEIKELLKLLEKPHVKSLLSVHDTVAQRRYDPELPPLPDDIDDDEDSVKIIRLVKNKEPLGATISRDEQTGAILIARIMRGGAADRSGLIHVGDELKEVNGIPVDDKKPEEIIRILAQSQGAITFKVVPGLKEDATTKEPKVYMKALFDYDPMDDKAIPCKEAGLAFKKGDILQIMSQDDATWWQAKHEGDANPRAGLIPSKQFQER